ncbi:MAG TPA: DUF3658 domain-containing protein [Blastocatellia bacterium]|nr:DUF3658 domain-containing protein [Blastocatellia bacterium]
MPSPAEIDGAILTAVRKHWRKVAMVNGDVLTQMREAGNEVDAETIAARIEALIEEGKLQCQGNPKRWRHSEVRLPHEGPERRHYVATVAIAFPSLEPEGPDEFDLYEMDILFESDSPEQALKDAIAISKQSPTWRGLEYPELAVLHAVRYIRPRYPLPSWHTTRRSGFLSAWPKSIERPWKRSGQGTTFSFGTDLCTSTDSER